MTDSGVVFSQTKEALHFLENQLECCVCHKLASSPVTLGGCEHIFCSSCCEPHLGRMCPVCDIPAHVRDAEVDRQLFNIVTLCQRLRTVLTDTQTSMSGEGDGDIEWSPKQPIPGSVLHEGHVTSHSRQVIAPKQAHGKQGIEKISKVGPDMKTTISSSGKRKTRTTSMKGDEITVTQRKSTESPRDGISAKRRKSVPEDQRTMTQFYDYDDSDVDEGSVVQKTKTNKSKSNPGKVAVNNSKTMKTRLRHHSDSSLNQAGIATKSDKTESGRKTGLKTKEQKQARLSLETVKSDLKKSEASIIGGKGDTTSKSRRSEVKQVTLADRERKSTEKKSSQKTGGKKAQKSQSASNIATSSQSLNKRNAKGETMLQVAVIKNDAGKVRQLLSEGADPNVRDNAGWTPLHEACNHGYLELVELLLVNGAMINVPGLDNDTPLHDAISNKRLDCVKLLVSHGASQTVRNIHGYTPQDLAVSDMMKAALNTPVVNILDVSVTEPVDVLEYQQPCLLGTSLSRDEKISLQKGTNKLHVRLVDEMCPEVTHIVTTCNADGMCPRTVKLLQGVLMGRWILNTEWFETCVQMGQLVCEEAFEVPGTSLFPNSGAMYKGRMNRKRQLPGLFNGCQFYFHGSFEYSVPAKEDLVGIIQCGGGQILTREPTPGHLDAHTLTVPYHAHVQGELAQCCIFLVHETHVAFQPIRTRTMCSVPAAWIMDSAANFKLMSLPKL